MLSIWPTIILGVALVLVGLAGILVLRSEEQDASSFLEQMTLSALSQRWVRPKSFTRIEGVKHISELAHLWRNEQVIAEGIEKFELVHPRSRSFASQLRTWSFFNQAPGQRAVCLEILRLLDREGQCPSVVDVQGDVEAAWEQNTYRILAKTTLLDHSLNVAEQVVKLLSDHQAWHVIPDTMVAALGHDLGKLKSARGSLYALGEHPLAAGAIISGIPGFKELSRKEDILRAIKMHHKMPEGLLGKTLKKADQQARQQEQQEGQHGGRRCRAVGARGSHHLRYLMPEVTLRLNTSAPLTYVADGTWFSLHGPVSLLLGPDETLVGGIDDVTGPSRNR